MKEEKLIGYVEDGQGDLNNWMKKYSKEYEAKANSPLFPGSLNLRTDFVFRFYSSGHKNQVIRMDKSEYGGERHILMLPCFCNGVKAFLWRTERWELGYFGEEELKLLEVLAPVKLRDHLNLQNNDMVTITF